MRNVVDVEQGAERLLQVEEHVMRARSRVRLARAYDARAVGKASAVDCGCDCVVQQQFKDETDVNTIVRRFGLVGAQVAAPRLDGVYGDFTDVTDYASAVAAIERARSGFMSLPPDVRERFGNDPGAFVEFAQGVPEEMLEAELGFVKPKPPEAAGEASKAAGAAAPAEVKPLPGDVKAATP